MEEITEIEKNVISQWANVQLGLRMIATKVKLDIKLKAAFGGFFWS